MLKNADCRLCGKNVPIHKSIRIFKNKNVLWNIQVLTGLILENAKCLPELICIGCQAELREAIEFSDKVIATQQQLISSLKEEELKELSEEYKTAVTELATNSAEMQKTFYNEMIVEAHSATNEIIKEQTDRQNDLIEYDIIIDDDAVIQKTEVVYHTSESIETIPLSAIVTKDINQSSADESKVLPDDNCQKLEESSNEPKSFTKKIRGRKRLGNLIFICDECGIHVSGRMAYELHRRRHRGDKQFRCTVCQDCFCTSSELKSHMRRHTGERPFACHYCDRFFADNSTRIKHERTHTNERPYACHSCGKAFTTTYILKNHMLTHSEERAFSCEMCNKTFRRHTHLVTHCRSRAHKSKLERQ